MSRDKIIIFGKKYPTMKKTAIASFLLILTFVSGFANTSFTLPSGFIENKGQFTNEDATANNELLYQFVSGNFRMNLFADGFSYQLISKEIFPDASFSEANGSKADEGEEIADPFVLHTEQVHIHFNGSNKQVELESYDPSSWSVNYFVYTNREIHLEGVKAFNKIIYKSLYQNIDLIFEWNENNQQLEYSFNIHPGGDISDIQFAYDGIMLPTINNNGALQIATTLGVITEQKPQSFDAFDGSALNSSFVLKENQLSFYVEN